MRYIKYRTYSEAQLVNDRVTAECLRNSEWPSGTNNYCIPTQDEYGQWLVPILEGYEKYFTTGEIDRAWDDQDVVPKQVPLWCLRTIIKLMGLFEQVNQAIENMPSNTEEEIQKKTAAREGWEYGNTVARYSYTTSFVQNALNLTDEQVNDIFINADKVDA